MNLTFICSGRVSNCLVPVDGEHFVTHRHLVLHEVGTIDLPLLTELGQDLCWLHRIPPLIVPTPKYRNS